MYEHWIRWRAILATIIVAALLIAGGIAAIGTGLQTNRDPADCTNWR